MLNTKEFKKEIIKLLELANDLSYDNLEDECLCEDDVEYGERRVTHFSDYYYETQSYLGIQLKDYDIPAIIKNMNDDEDNTDLLRDIYDYNDNLLETVFNELKNGVERPRLMSLWEMELA